MCRLGNGSGGVFAPAAIEWTGATATASSTRTTSFVRENILSMIEISGLEEEF
jgi:hypothetical protein